MPRKKAAPKKDPQAAVDALSRLVKQIMEENGGDERGTAVTPATVRGLPAVWYSISRIAGHVGSLPFNLYQRENEDDARIAREHPAYWLVKHKPSPVMTANVWRETMQHHVLLRGNGRSAIIRNGRGEPDELILMHPDRWAVVVSPAQVIRGVELPARKWHVRVDDPQVRISDEDCVHIMGLSDDGIAGLDVITAARQALGLAVAQQARALSSEKNGVRVKFLLKAPPGVFRDEGAAKQFIDRFNEVHSETSSTDKAALLREGVEAQSISQTNVDAQAIESRRFSRQDVGLLTCIEQMLGDDGQNSYASLEMKSQAYITNCLMRWLVRWQQECAAKLLTTAEYNSEEWYFRFVTAGLLRGTTKERYDVYNIARQIGVMNANEVRELEDMDSRKDPGGESYDNPATSSPHATGNTQQQSGDKKQEPPVDGSDRANARLAKVVNARIQNMTSIESARVQVAAAKESNFCNWVTEFYETWTNKISDVVSECDGPIGLAADWSSESQRRLLDVAGNVSQDRLSEAVRVELSTWQDRAAQLASAIIS